MAILRPTPHERAAASRRLTDDAQRGPSDRLGPAPSRTRRILANLPPQQARHVGSRHPDDLHRARDLRSPAGRRGQIALPPMRPGPILSPPAREYWLGTDNFGRPMRRHARSTVRASRSSSGFAATIGTMLIGAVVGIAAGYYGGRIDRCLNAFTDWFLVIPWLALAIVLAVDPRPDALQHHPGDRDHVVGRHRSARPCPGAHGEERPYVERARALGAGRLPPRSPATSCRTCSP